MNKDAKFFMQRFFLYGMIMMAPIATAMFVVSTSGCVSHKPDYHNIPLTQGDPPYRLPKGTYIDTRGVIHNEKDYRWSISEEDLFNVSKEDYLLHLKKDN